MADRAFRSDDGGFSEIARSPEMRRALAEVAGRGKDIAEALAADFAVTGEYASSFKVSEDTIDWRGRYPGHRAAATLANTSDHAAAVEWGNEHDHRPHHVLNRTLEALEHD